MAGYQDLFINQGETFTTQMNLNDSNGVPYNLTNFIVLSYAKKSYYTNNISLIFDASIYNANNGVIQLTANSAVTSNVPAGKLVYDVIVKDSASGLVTRVIEGQIIVSPGVTGIITSSGNTAH
jgi:hypothetical protein